jgi:hypothetical protein
MSLFEYSALVGAADWERRILFIISVNHPEEITEIFLEDLSENGASYRQPG